MKLWAEIFQIELKALVPWIYVVMVYAKFLILLNFQDAKIKILKSSTHVEKGSR
jgi:hypothetical protein